MKRAFVLGATVLANALACPSAMAGEPYANVESNVLFFGSDFDQSITDLHIGYQDEGEDGSWTYYIQAGPGFTTEQYQDSAIEFSGKVGGTIAVTDSTEVYGEVYGITTDDDPAVVTKLGAKFKF